MSTKNSPRIGRGSVDLQAERKLSFVHEGVLPSDGVYFRADKVTPKLRSFPTSGPENAYKDIFKIPDARTNVVPSRFPVPAEKKDWKVNFPEYEGAIVDYITEQVLNNSRNRNPNGWADPEPSISENDEAYSKLFKAYNPIWLRGISRDRFGRLLHPFGRTGMRGQGVLGNRSINEAVDPIVFFFDKHTKVLNVLLIKRNPVDTLDNSWAIPGGMVDYIPEYGTYSLPQRLGKLLAKYELEAPSTLGNRLAKAFAKKSELKQPTSPANNIGDAFRELKEETGFEGKVTYQKLLAHMYSDDVRNTDSTWIVTSVFLLVAEDCAAVTADGFETSEARWLPFTDILQLEFFASHLSMLLAAAQFYVVQSFADRSIENSQEHHDAFEYLKNIPELELPQTFPELLLLQNSNQTSNNIV